MSRAPFKRWHPGLGDTRSRDAKLLRESEKRSLMVSQRIENYGGEGLHDWLESVGVNGWCVTDRSEVLATIRKRLGEPAWRAALDIVVMM